jgi:hypothetical protein
MRESDSGLLDDVRQFCADVAQSARWVRIDLEREVSGGGIAGLDPELHFLEGSPEDVARYVLVLDAINFGSGWFAELSTDTDALTARLTAHARAHGAPWTPAQLRALDAAAVADVLGLAPAHELTGLYAQALVDLGGWLGDRPALNRIAAADGSAERFADSLAAGMPFYDDRGFYKRAQITANDLDLAGIADFADVDRLTVFADNLLPHVLRVDGVLTYADELAARVDGGEPLAPGSPMEVEIRACTVHACEHIAKRLDVPPRTLDNWLWNRGRDERYRAGNAHVTRTVFY